MSVSQLTSLVEFFQMAYKGIEAQEAASQCDDSHTDSLHINWQNTSFDPMAMRKQGTPQQQLKIIAYKTELMPVL